MLLRCCDRLRYAMRCDLLRAAACWDQISTIPGPGSRYYNGVPYAIRCASHGTGCAWDQIASGYGLAIIKRGTLGPGGQRDQLRAWRFMSNVISKKVEFKLKKVELVYNKSVSKFN